MPIDKRLKRELKQNFLKYFFVALILFLGIATISAFFSSTHGIVSALNTQRADANLEDASVTVRQELTEAQKEEMHRLGAADLEDTSYADLEALEDENYELRVFRDREDVNRLTLQDGRLPETDSEIVLEEKTAAGKDLHIGDVLDVNGTAYKLTGIVYVPDYNNVLKTVSSGIANFDSFGIGFVNREAFDAIADTDKVMQYSFTALGDEEIDAVSSYLEEEDLLGGILKKTDNPRIESIDDKAESMESEIIAIGIAFILLITFIFYVMSSASMEEDSTLIGTLFSMGYKRSEIVRHYLKLPLCITLIASVLGMVTGVYLLADSMGRATYSNYSLPSYDGILSVELILLSCVLPVAIQFAVNGLLLARKLRVSPVALMRGGMMGGKGFSKIKLTSWSFPHKMYIRIMLRGLKNQLVLFLGILIAMFFLVMGLGMQDTLEAYVDDVDENSLFEYCYLLNTEAEPEDSTADYDKATVGSFKVDYEGIGMKLTAYGLDPDTRVDEITDREDEIVISDATAAKLSLKEGDTLKVYSEKQKEDLEFEVVGIIHDPAGLSAYLDRKCLNELLEYEEPEDYYNAVLSEEKLDFPDGAVQETVTHQSMKEAAREMQNKMVSMISMLIVMAVLIFAAVMYILLKMIIEKSAYSVSLMKIFGYTDRENNHFYLNSFFYTVVLSLLITLPLDVALFTALWPSFNANLVGFVPVVIKPVTYGLILLFGIAVYLLVTVLLRRKLRKIPMTMILKRRD